MRNSVSQNQANPEPIVKPEPMTREDFIKLAEKFGNSPGQINDMLAALKLKEIKNGR